VVECIINLGFIGEGLFKVSSFSGFHVIDSVCDHVVPAVFRSSVCASFIICSSYFFAPNFRYFFHIN